MGVNLSTGGRRHERLDTPPRRDRMQHDEITIDQLCAVDPDIASFIVARYLGSKVLAIESICRE